MTKTLLSRRLPETEYLSAVRQRRRERGVWQRRYWEHTIRNDDDYARRIDYLHCNLVKYGHVSLVKDWPYSSFHLLVKAQVYPEDWTGYSGELEVGERS